MGWVGSWQNQYGSVLDISSEADGRIEGSFLSAVDGGIKGQKTRIVGVHRSDLITFTLAEGPIVCAWTGLLRDGRLETLWHVAASERLTAATEGAASSKKRLGIFEAITTGADTFVRK